MTNNYLPIFCLFLLTILSAKGQAQIIPDTTLPVNSTVTPSGNTSLIEGGTQAGGNLFHSFQEFSLPTGNTAFFNNSLDIQNIITRITGNSLSNIDGLIRANGVANLFLLNPNGIVFGPNARLNIGGSFLASTANSLNFADRTQFSTNPTGTTSLLTVSVPVGLQFNLNPGPIVDRSRVTDNNSIPVGLQVRSGRTLSLIGGDIQLEGGILTAERGRINLASLRVGNWSLLTSEQLSTNDYGNIFLSQQAQVNASGVGGGNVQMQGRQIRLTDGSQVKVNTLGAESGGNLFVNASDSVELIGRLADGTPSALQARVEAGASGTGGNVTIATSRLRVEGGARVATSSLQASGNAGNIRVNATDAVELIGVGNVTQNNQIIEQPSGLYSLTTGTGKAGNVEIETGRLIARDGGQVSSETSGTGDAGNLTVNADRVELNGRSPNGTEPSGLLARVDFSGTGNAGNLTVQTRRLQVESGARVATSALGKSGNAGNLTIQATEAVEVRGVGKDSQGNVSPPQISAITQGNGIAGQVNVQTGQLIITDGGQISASTSASGEGGSLNVNADDIQLLGRSPDGKIPSGLLARVETSGTGNAGDLNVQTRRLQVDGGARVATSALGETGNVGNLTIKATEAVEVTGVGKNPEGVTNPTQISAITGGSGTGGGITIETGRLTVRDGGQVTASTIKSGNASNLTVNADRVEAIGRSFDGSVPSGLLARVEQTASGNAGDVTVKTGSLLVQDGARVAAASLGKGNAGNVNITATDIVEAIGVGKNPDGTTNPAQISVLSTKSGNPGNLSIYVPQLFVNDRANLTAASATGRGGSITIEASGVQLRNQSIISADAGKGGVEGNIIISAETIVLLEASSIITDAENSQGGSNITIKAPAGLALAVFKSPDTIIRARGEVNVEGEVQVQTPDLPQADIVDSSDSIARACPADNDGNSFYVTGRGGLPATPDDYFSSYIFWEDLRIPGSGKLGIGNREWEKTESPRQIIEAQGWIVGAKGEIVLISQASDGIPHGVPSIAASCR